MNPNHLLLPLMLTATMAVAVPPGYEPETESEISTREFFSDIPCEDGFAGDFHCENVDLLSYLPLSDIGCGGFFGNDIWGWTDPLTGSEYALMGCSNGTSFVDVSDPKNPVYVGFLPTHQGNSTWRDIKVYADHAFVVCDGGPCSGHGLQVLDLTELRDFAGTPIEFANTAHGASFGNAHNLAINEDTGYAYVVGSNQCSGGLHIVDINDPVDPQPAVCFSADGYTHDTQCVIYHGPDAQHQGREICFNSNPNSGAGPGNTLTIVDVTDKNAPQILGREGYANSAYAHQGWLTEDHRYFLMGDELDEGNPASVPTKTYIWDVSDLSNPVHFATHHSSEIAIDHNQYVKGNFTYQSNYTAGLRILDLSDIADGQLSEVAYFNFMPHESGPEHDKDGPGFDGTWSNYPYFESGIVIVSVRGTGSEPGGLWTLQPRLPDIDPPGELQVSPLAHDFGEIGAGLISDLLEVTVSNAAQDPAQTLALTGIEITGDPEFGLGEGSTCDGDTELGPQDSCTIEVFFSPDASGQFGGEISVATGDDQSATIAVSGIGLPPVPAILTVEPAALDFGDVSVGGRATATLTVSNAAEMDADDLLLTQLEVIVGMPVFTRGEGTCAEDTALAPAQSCTVDIEFIPDTMTAYSGVFRVGANGGHQDVNLSGSGIEPAPVVFEDRFESE